MNVLYSLLAVLALVAVALAGGYSGPARMALAEVVPYTAFAVLLAGFAWRVARWASSPVPFRIPTTCGQQKSLDWIRPARIDNPSTGLGVMARMAAEVLLFRSLFRNHRARVESSRPGGSRLILGDSAALWIASMAFHWSLAIILIRHLRLFLSPVPAFVNTLGDLDGFFQFPTPALYLTDVVFAASLLYLLLRRLRDPALRYLSLFSDYFALFLLLGIAATGILMRYALRVDVYGAKQLAIGLATFHPAAARDLSPLFFCHLLLVSALAAYLPFSKLMHMGGIFLSPTRNLANNSRSRRHVNPWNHPVKTHTYAEWESEFHDKLVAAGIPLDKEDGARDAGTAHSH